jgi:hypothetical protein
MRHGQQQALELGLLLMAPVMPVSPFLSKMGINSAFGPMAAPWIIVMFGAGAIWSTTQMVAHFFWSRIVGYMMQGNVLRQIIAAQPLTILAIVSSGRIPERML